MAFVSWLPLAFLSWLPMVFLSWLPFLALQNFSLGRTLRAPLFSTSIERCIKQSLTFLDHPKLCSRSDATRGTGHLPWNDGNGGVQAFVLQPAHTPSITHDSLAPEEIIDSSLSRDVGSTHSFLFLAVRQLLVESTFCCHLVHATLRLCSPALPTHHSCRTGGQEWSTKNPDWLKTSARETFSKS